MIIDILFFIIACLRTGFARSDHSIFVLDVPDDMLPKGELRHDQVIGGDLDTTQPRRLTSTMHTTGDKLCVRPQHVSDLSEHVLRSTETT